MSGPAPTAERDDPLVPTPPTSTVNPEAYWQAAPLAPGTPDPNLEDVESGATHREPEALAG
jgi:hypothetical protein